MSLKDLNLRRRYATTEDDIVKDFYTPVLKNAVLYQRYAGFFSSSALVYLCSGLQGLVKNNGKIQLIVSPRLTPDDVETISEAYKNRDINKKNDVIAKAMLCDFQDTDDCGKKLRLNYLAYLIENEILDIKVAFMKNGTTESMAHAKLGIVSDVLGNRLSFDGSMNETATAFCSNDESFSVHFSWDGTKDYVDDTQKTFENRWNNSNDKMDIIHFPKVVKEKLQQYRDPDVDFDIDFDTESIPEEIAPRIEYKKGDPKMPDNIQLRDYQREAIDNWCKQDYRGVFCMATGTGKTYTGLGAIAQLFQDKKRLAVIILCPYQHLVDQWVKDIELFNMRPIVAYSKADKWDKQAEMDLSDFQNNVIQSFCFVSTYATYCRSKRAKNIREKLGDDTLLVVDEAHNIGSEKLRENLDPKIQYRLALSATFERYRDIVGTKILSDYFGEKCIEYGLREAIRDRRLTEYDYEPEIVYLNDEEIEHYKKLTLDYVQARCKAKKNGDRKSAKLANSLLVARSRIIAGAASKYDKLREFMNRSKDKDSPMYKNDTHMLVYCGTAKVTSTDDDTQDDESEQYQIQKVFKILGTELGVKAARFTSKESSTERKDIIRRFAEGEDYQAIVAIKCLDEGVDIPSIRTAFILASTTNPKEYIQRRGRVLRMCKGKDYATIYDFVTLLEPLDKVTTNSAFYSIGRKLAIRELRRIVEFSDVSRNHSKSYNLITELKRVYNIKDVDLEAEDEEETRVWEEY